MQVKEQNRLAREAHKQAAEAHRAAAVENRRRLALAEEQQAAAAAQLAADNAAALQQARQDYKVGLWHIGKFKREFGRCKSVLQCMGAWGRERVHGTSVDFGFEYYLPAQ